VKPSHEFERVTIATKKKSVHTESFRDGLEPIIETRPLLLLEILVDSKNDLIDVRTFWNFDKLTDVLS
jgi:hypothetical protein